MATAHHWVLIETEGNQAYIFDTNRLRHVVGASYLVHQLGTEWVPEAAGFRGARIVQAISGKALLLVDDPGVGRAVIRDVSARALREAPGLPVTGVVGPPFDAALDWRPTGDPDPADSTAPAGGSARLTHVEALAQTYDRLEHVREGRPSPYARDPVLPWLEICRESGLPVAGTEQHVEREAVAAPVLAKSDARFAARDRMRELLQDLPGVVPEDLEGLGDDGWIAVIHADGNGVGRVFTGFARRLLTATGGASGLSLEQHATWLGGFSDELNTATETAFGLAIRDAVRDHRATGTFLPVVVGGDDVTVVCHGRFALSFARAFAAAFEQETAVMPKVRAVVGSGLTAAVGIAYVKPHHPFSVAYALAEELTASAKRVSRVDGREASALDLHVAFESTLADLAGIRARLTTADLAVYGGPYVLTGEDSPPTGKRDIAQLDRTLQTVDAMSRSLAHELREGLAIGPEEYELRVRRAARSPDLPEGVRRADIEHLAPVEAGGGRKGRDEGERFVRLLDALLIEAISRADRDGRRDGEQGGGDEPGSMQGHVEQGERGEVSQTGAPA